ncbi:Zinc finger BED domain-containing protein 4 [Mycena venus]|uniref:Zinc finger BED domain-containing protein 4 n=1 Tax=Mycena venus TaxID=2733690 RepID=A0A8H6YHJ1_9AGAR|nr:Zinc finger BED domain-containing protein 4 [Mycena venus]
MSLNHRKRGPSNRDSSPDASATSEAPSVGMQPLSKRAKFEEKFKTATTSDKDVLALQKATWTSHVYSHFHDPAIVLEKNEVRYSFIGRARHDDSTSNLKRHVDSCEPESNASTRALAAFATGSSYNPIKHRVKLALWISRRSRPFAIAEDPELREIFYDLNNRVEHPSEQTVSRDIQEIFKISRVNVGKILQVFLVATQKISQNRVPLIHEVIPIFDVLTGAMDDFIDNPELSPCVRAAAMRGQVMMNKYYALSDDSIFFILGTKQPTLLVRNGLGNGSTQL